MKPPKITTSQMYRRFCQGETESDKQTPMYDKLNSCMKKRKHFLNKEAASSFATKMSLKTKENYVAYRCRWCNLFHIGHAKEEDNAYALPSSS